MDGYINNNLMNASFIFSQLKKSIFGRINVSQKKNIINIVKDWDSAH